MSTSRFAVTWNQEQIAWLLKNGLEKVALKVARGAGRDALRKMRTTIQRAVREKKTLKIGRINKGLRSDPPKGVRDLGDLAWSLHASGKGVALSEFKKRQNRKGVRVEVNRGSPKLIQGAFLQTVGQGHLGVFVRKGAERYPIRELFSSRIKHVVEDTEVAPEAFRTAQSEFVKTWERLLPLELAKAAKR